MQTITLISHYCDPGRTRNLLFQYLKHILLDPNFLILKSTDLFQIDCSYCKSSFSKQKKDLKNRILTREFQHIFCSKQCQKSFKNKNIISDCKNCKKEIIFLQSDRKKSNNYFCSRSCAATYNNTHKKHGNRRSKLEKWLEDKLTILYPILLILYSHKETINSELDIYIPSLNLAFELNGIYHYEPIHGKDKLNQIQNNDQRKFQACLEKNIELCIIDTSQHKYVKDSTNQKYLDIIQKIIDFKLNLVTD